MTPFPGTSLLSLRIVSNILIAVEPVGTETIVNVKVGDNVYKIITSPDFTARIAEKVYVAIDVDKIHLFEKKSGLALS
jgi:ABC-type sugar transport system ATPase subunit